MRNIAVIGLGGFGSSVARELAEKGIGVLAIDRDEEARFALLSIKVPQKK
jgi:Trk K+ transport system NAD-binding subunit